MGLKNTIAAKLGYVSKAAAQERVNFARDDMAKSATVGRTQRPIDVFDANYRPGGYPYSVLRSFARSCEPVTLCIRRVKTMMHSLEWDIVPLDEEHPADDQIEAGREWFSRKGGMGGPGTMIREFLDNLTDDLLVCGAIALYPRPTQGRAAGLGGGFVSIEPIDAGTIIPKRDSKGWVPQPPEIAYEQRLQDGSVTKFTAEELIYAIWGGHTYNSNGESFVEDCMSSILQFRAADTWNLVWFTEGDVVQGVWQWTGGGILSPEQKASFEKWLETKTAVSAKKGKPLSLAPPAGWTYKAFRTRDEADFIATQRFLIQRIAPFFGLTPSSLGFESDTYKASQEAQMDSAIRNALTPIAKFFGELFTSIMADFLDLDQVEFRFDTDVVDLQKVAAICKAAGTERISLNESREKLGLPKVSGGYADDLITLTAAGGVLVLASTDETRQVEVPLQGVENASPDNALNAADVTETGGSSDNAGGAVSAPGAGGGADAGKSDARRDLRNWQRKAEQAAKAGRDPAEVRFRSEAIPEVTQAAIREAMKSGVAPGEAFAPYLAPPQEDDWQGSLGHLLDAAAARLEYAAPAAWKEY